MKTKMGWWAICTTITIVGGSGYSLGAERDIKTITSVAEALVSIVPSAASFSNAITAVTNAQASIDQRRAL